MLDTDRLTLRRAGENQPIEPQVFDVLLFLINANGRVVSKEELLDEIWGDRFVSESALTTRIKTARRAVGDDGRRQEVIRTVHSKGYSFVAELHVEAPDASDQVDDNTSGPERLPMAVQNLIGRDHDVDLLVHELGSSRLTTLVGPAGVGKTSLAYEVARAVEPSYVDGVFAVEFVTVGEDAAVDALATALDVHARQGQELDDAVLDWLRPRQTLLLLDNCEHVVDTVGAMAGQIMRAAPDVSILATSREPLAVAAEQLWPVDPLPIASDETVSPDVLIDVPSIALFVDRARAVDPRFNLTEANVASVVEICRRLDGVPLAIELAAARSGAIDVAEIARRLDERFRLLKGVRRGTDPRHQVLEDAVRWSYDLLVGPDQRLFAELSVFAGQFDLADVEEVCGADGAIDVIDGLTRLAERSMVTVRRQDIGPMRYELFETLRDYGRSRLDDSDSVELFARHARHYAAFADKVADAQRTSDEGGITARADAAFSSLRSATTYATQVGDVDTALRLATSIREYAMRTMRYEALTWADSALECVGAAEHHLYPTALALSGYSAWVRGDFNRALKLAGDAVDDERDRDLEPSGLAERVIGNVSYVQGDNQSGQEATSRQVDLAEASGDQCRMTHAYYMHSVSHSSLGNFEEAGRLAALAQVVGAKTGSGTELASGFVALGFATHNDPAAALAAFDQSATIAAEVGNRWMSAFARTEAASLLFGLGQTSAACHGLADVIDIWFRFGEWAQQWHTLSRCVVALPEIGEAELAGQIIGAVELHATVGATPVMASLRDQMLDTTDSLQAVLGSDRYDELRATGAALPIVDLVHQTSAALRGGGR